MRAVFAALLATTALPAWADTILATSTITAVTVYPDGARITREVSFTAPSAGPHDLLVTDLPASTQPGLLRLQGDQGLVFGAFSLRADRLPPREDPLTPEQEAAKAEVERLEAAERDAFAAVEAVQARVDAANARATFLASFTGALPDTATPEGLKAMADMIETETRAAREAAALARKNLWPAQQALTRVQEDLAQAQAALDALPARDADYTALSVAVEAAAAGESRLTVTHYIEGASWRPFYDLYLAREGGARLTIDRSVLVTQYTGEDWSGVDLTLSTSRPAEQAAPSTLWPEPRRIVPEGQDSEGYDSAKSGGYEDAMAAAPVAEAMPAPVVAAAGMEGDTVVYHYPRAVDVASGVEDLRLSLDKIEAEPKVMAIAVPRWDRTAFVQAEFVNTSTEPLLPGEVLLFREGVLVGGTSLGVVAPGAETSIAFGALEAIQVSRDMPRRESGQSGFISTSNEASEVAVLKVENLGAEVWPVRVIDQVPYSEQEDLEITYTAKPAVTEKNVDGQRGILAWDFDLPAGAKQEISLSYSMRWPEGMVLQ
ncbi:DUF4139 domain-containing protein [Rhodobacter sp. Har01]|uniref:DUF4139 domain-containing protein n=1 Tax=Rhodobacter sp. Har01 TaxID=2883999 RepID=UPI001D09891A|nr:DUF4139 domain-containing protein [Rhodobacter sp. Har01]MCB6179795.1 DUF4139 domain-containing protein [Rhodobacter sp. Har01]